MLVSHAQVTAFTGIISTVAGTGSSGSTGDGGAATSAALAYPLGVSLDALGNVYIADSANNKIRKVSMQDHNKHTLYSLYVDYDLSIKSANVSIY